MVIRRPLTKVVEVETERNPIPVSAPELKDDAKKSRGGNNKVAPGEHGHVRWEGGRDEPRVLSHAGLWVLSPGTSYSLPEDPGKVEKKCPPPWCREPAPRSSEKGSISSVMQAAPISTDPDAG